MFTKLAKKVLTSANRVIIICLQGKQNNLKNIIFFKERERHEH